MMRVFVTILLALGLMFGGCAPDVAKVVQVNTTSGPVALDALGPVLMHEHLYYDDEPQSDLAALRARYGNRQAVVDAIVAELSEMKQAGCATLVDGSPRGLNRDAELLLDAANQAGVRVIASTGVFMGRFMPADLRDMSLDDVTALWTREITRGIDGTKLRAGIVKLSINAGPLVPLEEKFIRAAARTSLKTGVPIECHLTYAPKLVDIVRVLEVEKLPLNRFVWIHADAAGDVEAAAVAARQGMWVEVDSTWQVSESGRVDFLKRLLDAGVSDRVLLSQDYTAFRRQDGKGDGRFVDLFGRFKPLAMEAGVDEATWNKITVDNPRGVFAGD